MATAQALDFKGVPFGSDETHLRKTFPRIDCPSSFPGMCFLRDTTYAAEQVESIILRLIDGKLERFSVRFKPESFEAIADAMRGKYGAPTRIEDSVYQTVGGAKTTQTQQFWKLPDGGQILISRYGSSITSGSLSVNSAVAVQQIADTEKGRAAKAKGDI